MSEQNKILSRHDLQDTLGASAHGPREDPPISNLHNRLVTAAYEIADLRKASLGEPDKNPEAGLGEPEHLLRRKDEPELGRPPEAVVTLDDLHNMVQEIRDHLGWDRHFGEDLNEKAYGRSVMEDEIPGQLKRNKELAERIDSLDPWKYRARHMRCQTCMWYVPKSVSVVLPELGRCRHNAPTLKGYPAVFPTDWCGDHKLDETKL